VEPLLAGVRVLDLSRYLAGPYGSLVLADLGAEVLKVEGPGSRDLYSEGPFSSHGMEAFFMATNRGKKSIVLDLTGRVGREVFYELVRVSDVVYDNFRPSVPARLGVDFETLRRVNPAIVCCSITGYGSTGPYRDRPTYDVCVQALTGAVAMTGNPGGPPVRNSVAISDQGAGLLACVGILAALLARQRTGQGARVETSLLEATVHQLAYEAAILLNCGLSREPIGSGHLVAVPYGIYATADGHIALVGSNVFDGFCIAIDRPELLADPRFDSRVNRWRNRDALEAIVREVMPGRTTADWKRRLEENDVPCEVINSLEEALEDPQVRDRRMVVSVAHSRGGEVRLVGNPIKVGGLEGGAYTSPPVLGEHTDEVLSGLLGYGPERLAELRERGVIG
jgi:crotonobetainyl-CoA:carnitine CoA-transferase CaiB-like acyl-CoA transferase